MCQERCVHRKSINSHHGTLFKRKNKWRQMYVSTSVDRKSLKIIILWYYYKCINEIHKHKDTYCTYQRKMCP